MSSVGLNLSLGANIIEDCIRDVLEPLSNGFESFGCFAMRNVTRCYAKKKVLYRDICSKMEHVLASVIESNDC